MCLDTYLLTPIGVVRSQLKDREAAPRQGSEEAPEAMIDLSPSVLDGLQGIDGGDEIVVVTWLHEARRDVLKVHPRATRAFRSPGSSRRGLPTGRIPSGCTASPSLGSMGSS